MSIETIRLRFTGGLHIGRGAEELDKTATTYNSDALKSALFAVGLPYNPHWAETEAKAFFEGFRISSAFPFCGNDFFLPKPGGMQFAFSTKVEMKEAKKAKKITHVSAAVFSQWALKPKEKVMVEESTTSPDGAFLFGKEEAKNFLHSAVQQRVQVPLEGEAGDTRPFYFERLFFAEGAGLYFLLEIKDETLRPQLMHALHLLGDAGIGTDRTVGNGQFTVDASQKFDIPYSTAQNLQMALGLYLPTKDEVSAMDMEQSYWSLVKRGGYIAAAQADQHRSLRKNSIYFFGEGSAFHAGQELTGRLVDLKPSYNDATLHPVWRCGMPLFIHL